ncbi:MAG TPA: hypothetical protein VGD29_27870 [Actinoplanes sp.]
MAAGDALLSPRVTRRLITAFTRSPGAVLGPRAGLGRSPNGNGRCWSPAGAEIAGHRTLRPAAVNTQLGGC